jgi:hypothetical protein
LLLGGDFKFIERMKYEKERIEVLQKYFCETNGAADSTLISYL